MCKLEIIRFQIQADFLVCSLLINRKHNFFNFFFLSERKRKSDTLPDCFIIRSNINTAITSEFNIFLSENCGHFKQFPGKFFFFACPVIFLYYITHIPCWRKFPLTNAVSLEYMYIYVTLVFLFLLRQFQWHYFLNCTPLSPLILNSHSQKAKWTQIWQPFLQDVYS